MISAYPRTAIIAAFICLCSAQNGVSKTISTDRPGFSNCPGLVPTGVLQLESGYSYSRAGRAGDQYNRFAGGAALGFTLSKSTACFLEYYGVGVESGYGDYTGYFDGGLTWLLSDNCQVDIWSGLGISGTDPDYFVGAGLSYLFDL